MLKFMWVKVNMLSYKTKAESNINLKKSKIVLPKASIDTCNKLVAFLHKHSQPSFIPVTETRLGYMAYAVVGIKSKCIM